MGSAGGRFMWQAEGEASFAIADGPSDPWDTQLNTQPAGNLLGSWDTVRSPHFLFLKVLQDTDAFMASSKNCKFQLSTKTQVDELT